MMFFVDYLVGWMHRARARVHRCPGYSTCPVIGANWHRGRYLWERRS